MTLPKLLVPVLFVAIAAASMVGWYRLNAPVAEAWQGYVDADFVRIGPTLQGLLTGVPVGRGDMVKTGDILFTQDPVADRAARDESAAHAREARARLENLKATGRDVEIAQAAAEVANARAAWDRARLDFERAEALTRTAAGSAQQRDQARADSLTTEAKMRSAEAHLALLRSPTGRSQEIAAQDAVVGEADARLAQAEWRLAQRTMTAPADGLINDVSAHPGETVNAGVPVVSLLPPGNILVRFFVAEADLPSVRPGTLVRIGCDSCPAGLTAPISFVSASAVYTPPVIYSETVRGKLVYLIEARPGPNAVSVLKPGQPVTVTRGRP